MPIKSTRVTELQKRRLQRRVTHWVYLHVEIPTSTRKENNLRREIYITLNFDMKYESILH